MKNIKIIVILANLLIGTLTFAQAPEKMSYQAVVRNTTNNLVTNQAVGMQISILQGSATGTAVYVETQTPTSNVNGLVSLEIGSGAVVSGNMATIDWSNGPYFIKTETDPTGGSSYTITGTSQLLSAPYALYAKTSGSSIPGPTGPMGPAGPAGANGLDGATGPAGANGLDGTTGPMGPQGPQGLTGATGPAGANGTNGLDGATGPMGPQGPAGVNGLDGATGPMGPQGPAGVNGLDGATGPMGPQGPAGATGLDGATGPQGPQGPAGANGLDGATGPQGPAGTNGQGVPTGGTTGQVLSKINGTDFNTQWITPASNGWSLTGNAGTSASTNFIGTTDNIALTFRTNNVARWQISPLGRWINTSALGAASLFIGGGNETATGAQNTGIGVDALKSVTSGFSNLAVGDFTMQNTTTGTGNTAIGSGALVLNTTGGNNVAIGRQALESNNASRNTAVGFTALIANTTGTSNTSLGYSALNVNKTGDFNTAIGADANVTSNNLTNATAIGYAAAVNASNKIRLGNDAVTATDIAGQVKVNAQSTTDNFTLPTTRGTANQVLSTDGAGATQWVTPSAGGSGATLDLLATNTSSTAIFSLANGTNTGDIVTYNNVVTTPTLGSYNTSTNTYTVGVTGVYIIQAVTRSNDAATPSQTVGQFLFVDVNGAGVSSPNTILTDYPPATGSNLPAGSKGRGFTSVTLFLTAGQTVRVLGLSANSATAMQALKTDGSCKFMVVKL